jgi:hypothetical protein
MFEFTFIEGAVISSLHVGKKLLSRPSIKVPAFKSQKHTETYRNENDSERSILRQNQLFLKGVFPIISNTSDYLTLKTRRKVSVEGFVNDARNVPTLEYFENTFFLFLNYAIILTSITRGKA